MFTNDEREISFYLRRIMHREGNSENIIESLIKVFQNTRNNKEFIDYYKAIIDKDDNK